MNQENSDLKICPICGRPTHKESKYCIFHASAEEKTEEEFEKALKIYINKIKQVDGNYDFRNFIFIGYIIYFKKDLKVNIFNDAYFNGAIFECLPDFQGVTFKGDAVFREVSFKREAIFREAIFREGAVFEKTTFEYRADFERTNFKKGADFQGATFKGEAVFWEATFKEGVSSKIAKSVRIDMNLIPILKGEAVFRGATFEGLAYFCFATFKGKADFKKATFKENVDFRLKYFAKTINFSEIKIFPGKILSINIINKGGKISFRHAYIENIYLELNLCELVLIDFTDALLKNTKFEKDQIKNHILQEKKKDFSQAKKVFLLLKNNFHSFGQYEDESWAYKKEKDMERLSYSIESFIKNLESEEKKSEGKVPIEKKIKVISYFNWLKTKNFRKWLWSCFCNNIYGYGEKPQNVIFSAIFIILLFALSFRLIGIGNPDTIELKGVAVHQNTGKIVDLASKGLLKNSVIRNFPDSLYFSLITFTTLGYGDFRPLEGWGRILAGSEAFIGAFMMALFVYTFARRTGGR